MFTVFFEFVRTKMLKGAYAQQKCRDRARD